MKINNSKIQIKYVSIDKVQLNEGQIPGVPRNPRKYEKEKLDILVKNIQECQDMAVARPPLVFHYGDSYIVLGGNRRVEAMKKLRMTEIPVIEIPQETDEKTLRRIVQLDNASTGETDFELLAREWDTEELEGWGIEIPAWISDNPDIDIDNFFDEPKQKQGKKKTMICPHCGKEIEL